MRGKVLVLLIPAISFAAFLVHQQLDQSASSNAPAAIYVDQASASPVEDGSP